MPRRFEVLFLSWLSLFNQFSTATSENVYPYQIKTNFEIIKMSVELNYNQDRESTKWINIVINLMVC
jgi:hypothetical protein